MGGIDDVERGCNGIEWMIHGKRGAMQEGLGYGVGDARGRAPALAYPHII